jgi:acyl-coenzyme A thioesterase PaaI-like protein
LSENKTDDMMKQMAEQIPEELSLELPPKVFTEMKGELIEFDTDAQSIIVRFPVEERFQNPLGYTQGGIIVAAIDNTFGPLSYTVAPPSITTHMDIVYIRPITQQIDHYFVEAHMLERTRRQLFMSARAYTAEGKTLVRCNATAMIL